MDHYELPSQASSKKNRQRAQAVQPNHVQNLDDDLAEPEFLRPPELEPPQAVLDSSLREQVKYAVANNWKYDPIGCSAKAAVDVANYRDLLSMDDYIRIMKAKLNSVKKTRNLPWLDYERSRKQYEWLKNTDVDDVIFNFHAANLDEDLEEFYGPEDNDLRPVHNETDDEGFAEPNVIATTLISLPDNSLLEEGVTPGGIFQDSGIVMDNDYTEYYRAHTRPNTANLSAGMVPSDWPTFHVNVAALPTEKRRPLLGLVGDQEQHDWPGRRQGPYNLDGFRSWVRGSKEASSRHNVEASVEQNVETMTAPQDADPMVDAPIVEPTPETPLPAQTTPSIESLEGAQEVSEPTEGKVNDNPSEVTSPWLDWQQPRPLPGRNKSDEQAEIQEKADDVSTFNKGTENQKASESVPQLVSAERPQHLDGSNESEHDSEPSMTALDTIQAIPHFEIATVFHASHNIPTSAITTPVNQRILQVEQVQGDTPTTPATISINLTPKANLTPEYNSDIDDHDVSDDSLEVHVPTPPTASTQKGQSALGRYVQSTTPNSTLAGHSSSTISIAGSHSEEESLVPTNPSQPEGHAGFTKGVELHQKTSDAAFTLVSPKASQTTPSSNNAAPIPVTPANETDSAPFHPTTPFQLDTPAQNPNLQSPATPTPAPKDSNTSGKSVKNIFRSAKLASRSPERTVPSTDIVVAPTTPTAAGAGVHARNNSPFGSQGLLFHKAKKNDSATKNVLNSLKLSPAQGSGSGNFVPESLDDSEDELASEHGGVEVFKGGKWTPEARSTRSAKTDRAASAGRNVAKAVVVPSLRRRFGNDEGSRIGGDDDDGQAEEPKKKKPRRSMRSRADGPDADAGTFFDH